MSAGPSPWKSPMSANVHDESRLTGLPWNVSISVLAIAEPSIVQSRSEPSVLRSRMSDLPSALKWPVPGNDQEVARLTALPWKVKPWVWVITEPFIVQSRIEPSVLRSRMSDLPSPLKSPVPRIDQEGSRLTGLPWKVKPWVWVIAEPFIVQSRSEPSVLRSRMSDLP